MKSKYIVFNGRGGLVFFTNVLDEAIWFVRQKTLEGWTGHTIYERHD